MRRWQRFPGVPMILALTHTTASSVSAIIDSIRASTSRNLHGSACAIASCREGTDDHHQDHARYVYQGFRPLADTYEIAGFQQNLASHARRGAAGETTLIGKNKREEEPRQRPAKPCRNRGGRNLDASNDRVEKAIATIQELRRERDTLRRQLDDATARLQEQGDAAERASTLENDNERVQARALRDSRSHSNRFSAILGSARRRRGSSCWVAELLGAATLQPSNPATQQPCNLRLQHALENLMK